MIFRVDKWAVECHISRKIWQDSHSQVQLNLDMYFCFTTQHREFHKSAFSMWDRERERVTKRDRDTQRDGERETERHTCFVVVQSLNCVWLFCDPMDCNLLGSSVRGISQASILEWIAISFSRVSSWSMIEPISPALQADSLPLSHLGSPYIHCCYHVWNRLLMGTGYKAQEAQLGALWWPRWVG